MLDRADHDHDHDHDEDLRGDRDRLPARPAAAEPPAVGRPRGAAWRSLQAEGILWEGQVYLVGGDADLAARAIVTPRRLVFARGGEVALDVPRIWLRPAPFLRRNGAVVLNISPPDLRYGDPPETFVVRMREGHPAAGHLVAMLAGSGARRIPADLDALAGAVGSALPAVGRDQIAADDPWLVRGHRPAEDAGHPVHGAARAVPASDLLPPGRNDIGAPIWPDDPPAAVAAPTSFGAPVSGPAPAPGLPAEQPRDDGGIALVKRQGPPPVAPAGTRDWNLPFHQPLAPRSQRRHRWSWAFKLGGLVGLLATAAALGAGRFPSPLDSFGGAPPTPTVGVALLAEVTETTVPDVARVKPTVPTGIGGPSGPVRSVSAEPAPLVVANGTTETWAEPTAAPPAPAVIAPLGEVDGEGADAIPAQQPADPPTATPTATPAPEPTEAPAVAPVVDPSPTTLPPTATPAATATPQPAPTAPPPPPTATSVPPTATAAAIAPAAAESPAAPPDAAAAPSFAVRLAVGGATLPAFGLPPSDDGNWVVVVVDAANRGEAPAEVPMDDFRLRAQPGGETPLDPGSDLVAAVANVLPAYAPGDTVALAPGEAARLVLLFQVDPAAGDLELLAGDDTIDLGPALAAGGDVSALPADPAAP